MAEEIPTKIDHLPKKERVKSAPEDSSSKDGKDIGTSFKITTTSSFCWCSCYSTEIILDSGKRKDTWFRLVPGRKTVDDDLNLASFANQIVDPLRVLKHLYSRNNQDSIEMLKACRINPNLDPNNIMREDLEFYIPQLCNFIIFQEDFKNMELNGFLQEACEINFFFSHLVYWCLKSLSRLISDKNSYEDFPIIYEPLNCILDICSEDSKNKFLLAYSELHELLQSIPMTQKAIEKNDHIKEQIQSYGTTKFVKIDEADLLVRASDVDLRNYSSCFINEVEKVEITGFLSTVNFFEDLVKISDEIVKSNKKDRLTSLRNNLKQVNEKLPSAVYIPFFKNGIRNHAVLNIVVEEAIVFSTKERAPYYICVEIFRPEEDYALEKTALEGTKKKKESEHTNIHNFSEIDKHLSKPLTIKENAKKSLSKLRNSVSFIKNMNNASKKNNFNNFKSMIDDPKYDPEKVFAKSQDTNLVHKLSEVEEESKNSTNDSIISLKKSGTAAFYGENKKIKTVNKKNENEQINSENLTPKTVDIPKKSESSDSQSENIEYKPSNSLEMSTSPGIKAKKTKLIFGEGSVHQKNRIRNNSIYKNLKTWDLVHLIIKTHDNLKQEQFALQLIYQFDQIFKAENLNLKLRPYEVLSLGPDCGIMEMIKDSITIDALKRKIYENYKDLANLNEFFQFHYGNELEAARNNFCSSLAAYSLVCYILQIKDRHNCNILLQKDGYLIHIDFGFFLSNMPGKGLEFEKAVPFKLLTEYLEVLGGRDSHLFSRFRKLFYQGFKAVRKHRDKIILLVKMMYSIHGNTLPCFKSGEKCIQELEDRFDPKGIKSEGELNIFIQNLINESLDNLRTKWYDKFQYYFQGIFY